MVLVAQRGASRRVVFFFSVSVVVQVLILESGGVEAGTPGMR